MKKIVSAIFIAHIISLSITHYINAFPTKTIGSEATLLGQQLIRELSDNVKKANMIFKVAVGENERQNAMKKAHEAAQALLDALNDVKTFGTEVVKGYTPKQRQIAAIALADLFTRLNTVRIEIKSNRQEIANLTNIGVLIDTALPGKSEQRDQAIKEQKNNHATKKHITQAIIDQETILGQSWSNIIKAAIYNLLVGNSLSICYEIDWSFGAHNVKLLASNESTQKSMTTSKNKLTKTQHTAIKSWHQLSKSELLSKEISTAQQLTQAKNLFEKLNNVKEDLQNVPQKYQHIVGKVTEAADSLTRKIDRAKTAWFWSKVA